ncbi:MAG: DNA polymerase IV [Chitinophagaceae bacterium]|nr:DNA polymerase IV [Chitinophagaceae bacterium]
MNRKIIHIDMDAFFASVEQRDNPGLRGAPVVVGGSPEGRGGVVAAASYEARKYGIHSAMPSKRALQLCAEVKFIKPRFEVYKEVSHQIRNIFQRYTDLIEPLSLDEAYLDVTNDKQNIGSAITIAENIRAAITEELQLTASAGVSINKFVAKIASGMKKPDGLTFIGPSKIEDFMDKLAVEKFYGVGKVTAEKMKNLGLFTGADVKKLSEQDLVMHFGKVGYFFYKIVRGIDDRPVEAFRETQSVGAEDTFNEDLFDEEELGKEINRIAVTVADRLKRHGLKGRTITLKIKYSNFKIITRSRTMNEPVDDAMIIASTARELMVATLPPQRGIRLLGISLSKFNNSPPVPGDQKDSQLKFDF